MDQAGKTIALDLKKKRSKHFSFSTSALGLQEKKKSLKKVLLVLIALGFKNP